MNNISVYRFIAGIHITVYCIISVASAPTTCVDPLDLEKRFNEINNGLDYRELFFNSKDWNKDTIEDGFLNLVFQGYDKVHNTCPNSFYKGDLPLMIRSSCPWYLQKTFDDERFPKELYIANSKCNGCIGSNGQQKCERIHRQIKTLKRSRCINGIYQYEKQDEFIPVAFVCAEQSEVKSVG